jgi:hypothetical protein
MVVVGAAFTADAARAVTRALAQLPDIEPNAIARAPLGAVGRASEGKVLVAVCIAERAEDEVARIVDEFGGEIVSRTSYPEMDATNGMPTGFSPVDLRGTTVPGRPDN